MNRRVRLDGQVVAEALDLAPDDVAAVLLLLPKGGGFDMESGGGGIGRFGRGWEVRVLEGWRKRSSGRHVAVAGVLVERRAARCCVCVTALVGYRCTAIVLNVRKCPFLYDAVAKNISFLFIF